MTRAVASLFSRPPPSRRISVRWLGAQPRRFSVMARHPLSGSERAPLDGARSVGKADPAERLEVSVLVRRHSSDALQERVNKLAAGDTSHGHVKREDFAKQFGADSADIAAVKTFAGQHGLAVVEEHAARRTVVLSGTVA